MKIVIAPDSFKESLTAAHVAQAIERGVRAVMPHAKVLCVPMADGGEGTLDAVLSISGGKRMQVAVPDALGRPINAGWGWLPNKTAVIEMASAAGLEQIAASDRDPLRADTHGVGELLTAALDAGAQHIVLTAGGSATNDAGAGMLRALGLKFLDGQGRALAMGGEALGALDRIDPSGLDPRLKDVKLTVATDVRNPLCGPNGASAIFGPQKGATPAMVQTLDQALARFADLTAQVTGQDLRQAQGAGAAGGLGFAAMAWLNAQMRPGVDVVADLTQLSSHLSGADLVITGEGRMDSQTLQGKTPWGVMQLAHNQNIPVIAIVGSLGHGYQNLYPAGLTAAFSLTNGPIELSEALEHAAELLEARATDVMRLWVSATHAHAMRHSSE